MDNSLRVGHVDVKELTIASPSGNQLDISGMFVEFDVWENIYSHTLSGTIVIADTYNLISNLPLIGEEYVYFKYIDRNGLEMNLLFRVYKVSERIVQGNKQIYKIHVITPEAFINLSSSVSKAFVGHAENIIKQLISDNLGENKKLSFDNSSNLIKFVAPYWKVFNCIQYATQKALSTDKYQVSDFVFYESFSGYNFRSIQSLITFGNPSTFFKYDHSRAVDDKFVRQFSEEMDRVLDWRTNVVVDQISRTSMGAHSNKTYSHDLLFKTMDMFTVDTLTDFNQTKHLNQYPHFSSSAVTSANEVIQQAHSYAYSHDEKTYDWQGLVTNRRLTSLSQLEMTKLEIDVWGRAGIEPGHQIHFEMIESTQDQKATVDKYYSGVYLVSAICHRFAPKEYKMTLQLVKESSAMQYG